MCSCALVPPSATLAGAGEKLGVCQDEELEDDARRAACDAIIADLSEPAELRAEALVNRGIMSEDDDELDDALADFTAAIALNPDYPVLYERRGLLQAKLSNGRAALEDLDMAVKLTPDSAEFLSSRASVHMQLGDNGSAQADLGEAIRLEPDDADYHAQRGMIHLRMGLNAEAETDARKALTLEPEHDLATRTLDELRKRG